MSDLPISISYLDQLKAEAREEARTDFIKTLLNQGLLPATISNLGLGTIQQVTQILHVHLNGHVKTPEDEELAAAARKLMKRCLSEAEMWLDIGPMEAKLRVFSACMPAARKMIGNDEGNSHEQAFQALQELLGSNRVIGP